MYKLHEYALAWERSRGLYQPPDPSTLLVGFLGNGNYHRATITQAYCIGARAYLTVQVAGKGQHDWDIYTERRDGSPSWAARELLTAANVRHIEELVGKTGGIRIDGKEVTILYIKEHEKPTPPTRTRSVMGWGNH